MDTAIALVQWLFLGAQNSIRRAIEGILVADFSLILGQEQDEFNGGFEAYKSFSGRITQFNIWGR